MQQRLVIDTNVLISRLLSASAVPAQAVRRAFDHHHVIFSEATMFELADVLARPKFDAWLSLKERQDFVAWLGEVADFVPILHPLRACRDPRDDKFLDVAVHGAADAILTGDADLLAMHPFRGIAVLTPAAWLAAQPPAL